MRAVQPVMLRRALLALGLTGMTFVVHGCAAVHDGFETTGRLVSSPVAVEDQSTTTPLRADVKTVRPSGSPETPVVEQVAVSSPREIFDFHPPGSRADTWRQPFVIDIDDGPLAADVHKTAAELKAFNAQQKAGAVVAARKPCGETEVATGKPGCAAKVDRSTAKVDRNPLALQ